MENANQFDLLAEDLMKCLQQATALDLEVAIYLLNMTLLEVTQRSVEHNSCRTGDESAKPRFSAKMQARGTVLKGRREGAGNGD